MKSTLKFLRQFELFRKKVSVTTKKRKEKRKVDVMRNREQLKGKHEQMNSGYMSAVQV